jgi:cell division protein DivIC
MLGMRGVETTAIRAVRGVKIESLAGYRMARRTAITGNQEHFPIFDHSFFQLMFKRIPPVLRNFYSLTGILFLVWMMFLDSNDLINRFRLTAKLRSLEHEKEYYRDKIKEVEADRAELMGTNELLEKFAREKYLMKRDTEDIFIIEEAD